VEWRRGMARYVLSAKRVKKGIGVGGIYAPEIKSL
jgi:hypothetical protein